MAVITDHEASIGWAKVAVAWIGLVVGGVTLSTIALILTIAFTSIQIWKAIREIRREMRLERLEAKLKHEDTE